MDLEETKAVSTEHVLQTVGKFSMVFSLRCFREQSRPNRAVQSD